MPASLVLRLSLSILIVLAGCGVLPVGEARAQATAEAPRTISMFSREGCPRCAEAKAFLEDLARRRPEVSVVIHDVGRDPAAREELRRLAGEHGVSTPGLPSFLVNGTFVTGFVNVETTGARLVEALDRGASADRRESSPGPGAQDGTCSMEESAPCADPAPPPATDELVQVPLLGRVNHRELGLPLFTIALGLLDGFNPCAMWVLLLLLSFLVTLQSRSRMLLVGGTFVLISGAVYFAFMAAWLNVFLFIGMSRAVQATLGTAALVMGAIHVKDFVAFKKGVSLSIPESAKPGIYRRMRAIAQAKHMPVALAGAAVLALLVNMVELLCTAGLPAIYTRILTLRELPAWQYYGYLALYNVAYMADDALMLTLAVVTLGRRKLQEREGRWLKLVSGIVMIALGGLLVVNPSALF